MFTILGTDGKEYGPVGADKIREWINGGRANAHTSIKRAGETQWTTIGALIEFNPSAGVAPPEVPPPLTPESAGVPAAIPAPAPTPVASAPAPASRWLRLGAALLDGIIASFFMLPGFGMLLTAGLFSRPQQPNTPLMIAGCLTAGVAFLILLGIQMYLLTTQGQTLGKKLLGIRIVSFEDGTNPGFVKAFLLRSFVNGLIGSVPGIGSIYSLVDVCFIFRADRRCIHDLIAGTRVVKV